MTVSIDLKHSLLSNFMYMSINNYDEIQSDETISFKTTSAKSRHVLLKWFDWKWDTRYNELHNMWKCLQKEKMPTTRENIDNKIKLSATRKNAGYQGKCRQQRKMCVARENVGKIGK